jgi:hypothetical protein
MSNHVAEVAELTKNVHVNGVILAFHLTKQTAQGEDLFGNATRAADAQKKRTGVISADRERESSSLLIRPLKTKAVRVSWVVSGVVVVMIWSLFKIVRLAMASWDKLS